jgi:hypothetical protein
MTHAAAFLLSVDGFHCCVDVNGNTAVFDAA